MNYQLIDNNEKVFATLSDPNWVKIDREGKKIFSFWEDANAVYYKNTFYTIMGRFIPEAAKDYETIYVGILDDRSLLTELESTQMWNNLVCGGGTNGNRM